MLSHRALLLTTLAVSLAGGSLSTANACSIPVFRYALEHWTADPFRLHLFHRGPLTSEQAGWLELLGERNLDGEPVANLRIETIDVEGDLSAEPAELWAEHRNNALPHLVLQRPATPLADEIVWTGALSASTLTNLHDSPLRQTIARQLIDRESVVWVLLESGDQTLDDAAWKTLTTELDRLEETLELEPIDPADAAELTIEPEALQISFEAHRLSRGDPLEAVFIETLLSVEPDLRDEDLLGQPMAFPIFGRGRALYALVGEGISRATIEEASRFLTTGCQCTVKRDNPGADLLFAVDWSRYIDSTTPVETRLPPLTGLQGFGESRELTADPTATFPAAPSETTEPAVFPRLSDERRSDLPSAPSTEPMPGHSTSLWNTLTIPILIVVGLVLIGTVIATRRSGG